MYVLGAGMEPMAALFKDNRAAAGDAMMRSAELQLKRKAAQQQMEQALGLQNLEREKIGSSAYQSERDRRARADEIAANLGVRREDMIGQRAESAADRTEKGRQFDAGLQASTAAQSAQRNLEAKKMEIEERFNSGRLSNEGRRMELEAAESAARKPMLEAQTRLTQAQADRAGRKSLDDIIQEQLVAELSGGQGGSQLAGEAPAGTAQSDTGGTSAADSSSESIITDGGPKVDGAPAPRPAPGPQGGQSLLQQIVRGKYGVKSPEEQADAQADRALKRKTQELQFAEMDRQAKGEYSPREKIALDVKDKDEAHAKAMAYMTDEKLPYEEAIAQALKETNIMRAFRGAAPFTAEQLAVRKPTQDLTPAALAKVSQALGIPDTETGYTRALGKIQDRDSLIPKPLLGLRAGKWLAESGWLGQPLKYGMKKWNDSSELEAAEQIKQDFIRQGYTPEAAAAIVEQQQRGRGLIK